MPGTILTMNRKTRNPTDRLCADRASLVRAGVFVLALFIAAVSLGPLGAAFAYEEASGEPRSSSEGGQAQQTECPVMIGNKIDPNFSTIDQGRRVYFCCKFCLAAFEEAPEKYRANLPPPQEGTSEVAGNAETMEGGHDHATDHGQPHGLGRLVRFAGKFHPLVVHFPIALVIAAALAEILAFVTKSQVLRGSARFMIVFGAVCAAVAALLGWAAGAFSNYPEGFSWALSLHRWLGTSVGLLVIIIAVLCELSYRRESRVMGLAYRALLFLAAILVGLTGYWGGVLVYGLGHYSW